MIVLYLFAATIAGLVQSGIRFLWVHMYTIKARRTAPQALLITAIVLMLSLLALNSSMTTVVAPQYAQFGSQRYVSMRKAVIY
jgi:LMBR1 domain-containing protein 1